MDDHGLAKYYAAIVGVVLVALGLLGSIANPIVAEPTATADPLFHTDAIHDIIHLGTGLAALYVAFVVPGEQRPSAVVGFGLLYVAILVLALISSNLFGILRVPLNPPSHILNAALAVTALGVGYMARDPGRTRMAR